MSDHTPEEIDEILAPLASSAMTALLLADLAEWRTENEHVLRAFSLVMFPWIISAYKMGIPSEVVTAMVPEIMARLWPLNHDLFSTKERTEESEDDEE
jgi:hypothetical protein